MAGIVKTLLLVDRQFMPRLWRKIVGDVSQSRFINSTWNVNYDLKSYSVKGRSQQRRWIWNAILNKEGNFILPSALENELKFSSDYSEQR